MEATTIDCQKDEGANRSTSLQFCIQKSKEEIVCPNHPNHILLHLTICFKPP